MKNLVVLAACLLVGGCASPSSVEMLGVADSPIAAATIKSAPPSKDNLVLARAAVGQMLKDPGSARFSTELQFGEAICGAVSSKNSLGGYAGEALYVYVNTTGKAYIMEHQGSYDDQLGQLQILKRYCPS